MNSWGVDWGEIGLFRVRRDKNDTRIGQFALSIWGRRLQLAPGIVRDDGLYYVYSKYKTQKKQRLPSG